MESQALLLELASRLRRARQEGGWPVSELARRAGLSRRHVTELEAGRANPTLLVLARLAGALGVRLGALCDLSAGLYRGERLALVGLRGAGKSTLGRLLAREIEAPFVELDERVERLAGLSLSEIFALHGTAGFHGFEADALERVLAEGERLVLATGGSIVDSPGTFERLRRTCRTVWLRATPEEHFQRVLDQGDRRPMADRPRAMDQLRALLERRSPLYALCDDAVETSGRTPEESLAELVALARAGEAR